MSRVAGAKDIIPAPRPRAKMCRVEKFGSGSYGSMNGVARAWQLDASKILRQPDTHTRTHARSTAFKPAQTGSGVIV